MTTTYNAALFARPKGRPNDLALTALVDKFLALKPGDSIFLKDAKSYDLDCLRKPVKKRGAGIKVVQFKQDPKHGVPGVRAWRIAGKIDEYPS